MPVDMSKYPADWQEIRRQILIRAGGQPNAPRIGARCEFCGIENYAVKVGGIVIGDEFESYREARDYVAGFDASPEMAAYGRARIVVLTIAHLHDPNPMNCDPDNLAALCQKCHNQHDAPMRLVNRQKNARAKRVAGGQMEMEI